MVFSLLRLEGAGAVVVVDSTAVGAIVFRYIGDLGYSVDGGDPFIW